LNCCHYQLYESFACSIFASKVLVVATTQLHNCLLDDGDTCDFVSCTYRHALFSSNWTMFVGMEFWLWTLFECGGCVCFSHLVCSLWNLAFNSNLKFPIWKPNLKFSTWRPKLHVSPHVSLGLGGYKCPITCGPKCTSTF
jgi:hypothetical protein